MRNFCRTRRNWPKAEGPPFLSRSLMGILLQAKSVTGAYSMDLSFKLTADRTDNQMTSDGVRLVCAQEESGGSQQDRRLRTPNACDTWAGR